jgi:putative transcriptional regulator
MPRAASERSDSQMRRWSASIVGFLAGRDGTALRRTRCLAGWRVVAAILLLGLLPGITDRATQEKQDTGSQGNFLVARRELLDPFFEKSVVLMLPTKGAPLLVGLIVNRPTRVPLRDLFADSPALQKVDTTAYFGGPVDVEVGARSAIFRSKTPPKNENIVPVFGDVYVCFDPDTIVALLEDAQQATTVRVFLGRSQWAPAQLENEMTKGAWYSVHGNADPIFGKFPEAVWRSLLDQAEPRPVVKYELPFPQLGNVRLAAHKTVAMDFTK